MMLYICTKFHGNDLNDFRVMERTRFVADRQTDGQRDNYGKRNMSPPEGGCGNIIREATQKVSNSVCKEQISTQLAPMRTLNRV